MIEKLLDDLYWDGLDAELKAIADTHPYLYVPYQERDAVHLLRKNNYFENLAMDDFIVNFIHHRSNFLPYSDRYHGGPIEKFETIKVIDRLSGDLSIFQNRLILMIEGLSNQKSYEADQFFFDPLYLENIKRIKNLEELWSIFKKLSS